MPHARSNANEKNDTQLEMYTIGESAKFLGVPLNTAKEWRKRGKFPVASDKTEKGWDLWTLTQLRAVLAQRGQPKENRQNS